MKSTPTKRHVQHSTSDPSQPLQNPPLPFDTHEHGSRYRRQIDECVSDTRYVLFMLDTSASISRDEFNNMTHQLSRLALYFCKAVKIAVMTFNHEYYVEFCFGCRESDCNGRRWLRDSIRNINYRGGLTYTAGAAQCACNYILSAECGFNESDACIDVVVITDGLSNDPELNVCEEIECFETLRNVRVNVFAFGISDNINYTEINCIANLPITPGLPHIFNFNTFTQFEVTLNQLFEALQRQEFVTCADPPKIVGDTLDCRMFDES